jgi:hypothetical protein
MMSKKKKGEKNEEERSFFLLLVFSIFAEPERKGKLSFVYLFSFPLIIMLDC